MCSFFAKLSTMNRQYFFLKMVVITHITYSSNDAMIDSRAYILTLLELSLPFSFPHVHLVLCTALPCHHCSPSILSHLSSLCSSSLSHSHLAQAQKARGKPFMIIKCSLNAFPHVHPWTTVFFPSTASFRAVVLLPFVRLLLIFCPLPLVPKLNKQRVRTVIFTTLLLIASLAHNRPLTTFVKFMKKMSSLNECKDA